MDLVSAAMSLYLLFPILTDRQQRYSELIKKNLTSSPQEVEKRIELVKFLELEDSQYSIPEELVSDSETQSPAEKKDKVEEIYLRDIHNHLAQFEFGEEKFSINDRDGLRSSVVSVNGDTVTRTKYDSDYRVIESIVWKNKNTVSESTMVNKKNWFYTENEIYMTEDDFVENTFSDTVFNTRKLPVKLSVYLVKEEKLEDSEDKAQKKNLSRIEYFDYDEQDRMVTEKKESYEQRINETTGRQKDVIVFTSEKRYEYKDGFDVPDMKYFEDGKLRQEVQWVSESTYYESLYFPGGAGVRTKYIDDTKVEEKLFLYGDK